MPVSFCTGDGRDGTFIDIHQPNNLRLTRHMTCMTSHCNLRLKVIALAFAIAVVIKLFARLSFPMSDGADVPGKPEHEARPNYRQHRNPPSSSHH